ncbi:MAG: uracil phosphoribosyltransferase [Myxococcota bacterium]
MADAQYADLPRPHGGVAHAYGPRVHLLSFPYPMSLLSRLCQPETTQPEVDRLVSSLYDWMLGEVSSRLLQQEPAQVPTRMQAHHPVAGQYIGQRIARRQRVVVVDVARAGTLPAHRVYHGLHHLIEPADIRQDHIVASRVTDDAGQVTGASIQAAKIGGGVRDAAILIPDPMAATGASLSAVITRYQADPDGAPRVIAALHLIATPEYLRRMTTDFPELEIFAVRLDRGLSPAAVLGTRPGERWDEERGLNDIQYIVPGAGGVGELLNNAWV